MKRVKKGAIRSIKQDSISSLIDSVGYDIISNVIGPMIGVDELFADLYLVSPSDYLAGENREDYLKLFTKFKKRMVERYGLKKGSLDCFSINDRLMLYTMSVLEFGDPKAVEKALKKK